MIIDTFYDMKKSDIKAMYQKSENAFNVAVNRMLKELEDDTLKYKDELGNICIKAKGVEWLHNYFQKPADLSLDPIVVELEQRIKVLEAQLLAEKEHSQQMKETLEIAFNGQLELIQQNNKVNTMLIETKARIAQDKLTEENESLKAELNRYQPTLFGLYKKNNK